MIYDKLFILAQAAAQSPASGNGGAGSSFTPFILMGGVFVVFYFMLIRPQNQRQKQQQALIASMKTGDKVITAGGMHGLIANVKETTVIVKVADNVKIEVDKASITSVTKRSDDEPAAAS